VLQHAVFLQSNSLVIKRLIVKIKMKKYISVTLIMLLTWSASPVFATASNNNSNGSAAESSLSKEEEATLTSRVEEIRNMDKSNLTAAEKGELKNELNEIKETVKNDPYVYIGSSTLILILILLIILL
jgi:PBP1b-binding outer membrane lipoprotein LpoB